MGHILTFVILFLVSMMVPCISNPVSFYKLSLQWPPSACSSGKMKCPNPLPPPYNQMLTIHGIWPQDVNDEPLDPYDPLHPCTPVPPPDRKNLRTLLKPIYQQLNTYWPDLKNPLDTFANEIFWGHEWDFHGKCSDYPTDPLKYFDSAVKIRVGLPDFGLKSGDKKTAGQVITLVSGFVHATPEIACNRNITTRVIQLWEIRLCYDRPSPQGLIQHIRDCPSKFTGSCKNAQNTVTIP
ncbi:RIBONUCLEASE 1, ribonuclease 1 [Hibiscus trionum]|uniref:RIBONUCLEASE 1, ribonuclease 1 n=3 Tax=Hibiscus trionum TaxID=183268 RepID=A0A9W7LIQ2_HIBTR|nr:RIBONUCLEASE 1, ribonuclease 1 [Hibiscus trionum]